MSLEITLRTAWVIYLDVTFNGRPNNDCVAINLETNEGTFWNRDVNGNPPSDGEPKQLTLKGEFQLGFSRLQPAMSPESMIEEMRHSVLWNALTDEQRAWRFKHPESDEPLPRDAESKVIFEKLFRNYLVEVNQIRQ